VTRAQARRLGAGELLAAAVLLAEIRRAWAPPPTLTISAWADQYRVLSSAASPSPGPWRTDREPWQRGIMDAFHENAETIVVMKSGQVGVTESAILNAIGYYIAHDPAPMLLVEPSEALAKRLSRNRLAYMLAATPALRVRVAPARAKSASSSMLHKIFTNGYLVLAGANSPTALASDPMRLVFFDEVDKYPEHLGDEGDPVSLGMKRTTTYWNRRHLLVSTPTVKHTSAIEQWFLQSDQRRYFVPCPRCEASFVLRWEHVRWPDGDPASAHLVCPHCAGRIEDHERPAMIAAGAWRATAPFRGVIGFHIWEAYTSRSRLAKIVTNFLRARELGREQLREWTNQTLGETWEDPGDAIEPHTLLARRERYLAEVPAGVLYLTAGVDTQDDRLEVWVWGWGLGEEAWLIDVRTLPGDPAKPEVWAMLDELLERQWGHARGHRPMIAVVGIDSGGHRTDHVYAYAERQQHRRVYATIGRDGQRPIWTPGHQPRSGSGRRKVPLYVVGVDNAKAEILSRLRLPIPGPGFMHLPLDHPAVDETAVAQLTSERLVTRYKRGRAFRVWELARPGQRNEGLDATVLALWALRALRPDLPAAAQRLAATPSPSPSPVSPPPAAVTPPTASPPASEPLEHIDTAPTPPPDPPRTATSSRRGWGVTRSSYVTSGA
jgi:phage terminase large subunit GpA-like protein